MREHRSVGDTARSATQDSSTEHLQGTINIVTGSTVPGKKEEDRGSGYSSNCSHVVTFNMTATDDSFELYDLRVEVVCPPGAKILCGAKGGDHFTLEGEMLYLPPGQGISIYSLGPVLPLLAAKQRKTHPNDWMSTDALVACADPNCKSVMKIIRTGLRKFNHSETTVVSLEGNS